jgi:hypothetical protein
MKIKFHPACLLFPRLPKDELKSLAADIKLKGLLHGVVRYQGRVLDGRNRLTACKMAKVKPWFVEWDGNGSPTEWIISENLIRRHLSASQKAVVALDLLPLLEEEAKERQRLSQGRGKKVAQNCATFSGKASSAAARIVKTSSTYVEVVKAISKVAPELIEKVRNGDLSIPDAKRLSELPKEKRAELLRQVNGKSHNGEIFRQWKAFGTPKVAKAVHRTVTERKSRIDAVQLIHGDCRKELKKLPPQSADAVITDPIYPEVSRQYGRISEDQWHSLMQDVVAECRRVLKPKGSAVFILQPNFSKLGQMRLWLWEFVVWAAKEWNLVQDCYWWATDALPLAGTDRKHGLMRQSVKTCVWLGPANCYRNQDAVLWTPSQAMMTKHKTDFALRVGPAGRTYRNGTIAQAADERGGTTPFNLLPIPNGGRPGGTEHHPATTPYDVAAWWCRYLLPPGGVLLDPFCGSGTMLMAGLDHDASKVIGVEKEKKYLAIAKRRIAKG